MIWSASSRSSEAVPRAVSESSERYWPETWVNPRDGSVMRLIPMGEFIMGSTPEEIEVARQWDMDGPLFALLHETPQFQTFLPAFYISLFAVTNEQFLRFLDDRHPTRPELDLWLHGSEGLSIPDSQETVCQIVPGRERHPVVHVTFFGAEAYCRWAGLRLPTEMEWEKAARGTDARIFPWGNEWRDDALRWYGGNRGENETTAPVDAYPEGHSPYGIVQMAGNVEEWCADWYQADAYARYAAGARHPPHGGTEHVLRGGACLRRNKLEFRCAMRRANPPAFTNIHYSGIRCACDLPPLTAG